ncbi:DUF427 domain-containing protein [Paeniglutamicibacter cryotolerans]|uniref:Uncharacterized protein (DUF427 family) n=1 Tax=Paeniglutamicibacter cryotolerans TaxID=670079 RepID=A0A839QXX3_9MICC|nr:DUF427 domain-containing protein [Paeniglutamicibacter cryotolerans]MBB2996811.1 uncharacterized protein (DUF427 family) [Paeniglutamicibacter cryotolerans]
MATQISHELDRLLPETRFEPTPKRIRAFLGSETVLDSVRAVLFWEPRRVVPCYAVPIDDVLAVLEPTPRAPEHETAPPAMRVLHPGIPFAAHSCPGLELDVQAGSARREAAAFRPRDPELNSYVAFSFNELSWMEEDEPVASHPRDPFHRVDVRASAARVLVTSGSLVLADSIHPKVVFETHMGPRYYLPPEDVHWQALLPTSSSTGCAYKGIASYWALADGEVDVAWSYLSPLPDAAGIADMVCFYDDRVQVTVSRGDVPASG